MAECVKAYLRYDPDLQPAPVDLTIVSGLVNGPHTMEISVSDLRSSGMDFVEAFRVYHPGE